MPKLNRDFVESYANVQPPWGPVGYLVYKRTYARPVGDRTEEWHETIERIVNEFAAIFTVDELKELYHLWFNMYSLPAGRPMWQLGTETVKRIGSDSLFNCWVTAIDDPIRPFCFAFNELMLGGGVGFNIQREFVYSIPPVKFNPIIRHVDDFDCDLIVTDNREGWVDLLRQIMTRYFYTGQNLTYTTKAVRTRGKPIKSFGGKACGPEVLVEGMEKLCVMLDENYKKKLRPVNCLDIMNIIGSVVVAGNVRRSAQLALGDTDDLEFLRAKRWDLGVVPDWRRMSNNAVACDKISDLQDEFWEGYWGNGEPYGLVNLPLSRRMGRLIDGPEYKPDPGIIGYNPCAEIGLESEECCDLGELIAPRLKTKTMFLKNTEYMYKVLKYMSCGRFIHPESQKVVDKNHRLGLGMTGLLESDWMYDSDMANTAYYMMEQLDKKFSAYLGVGESIKLTTIKPSGTISLLPGVTPGIHPAYSDYYIRRIRLESSDPMVQDCHDAGYHIEPELRMDGSQNEKTIVASFPIKSSDNATKAAELSVTDQLDNAKWAQGFWSDNSVSVTNYYGKGDIPVMRRWLNDNYEDSVKTTSFLLHSGHNFIQAPLEAVSAEAYEEMKSRCRPIVRLKNDKVVQSRIEVGECEGGTCPVR